MIENNEFYSVWVGGTEVNDYFISIDEAQDLAKEYEQDSYQDVKIQKRKDNGI